MKKILIIIMAILLLFSFGCQTMDKSSGDKEPKKLTGKNGILVEFDDSAPPKETVEGKEINVRLEVTNRGKYSLSSGDIRARLIGVAATETLEPTSVESSNEDELLAAELDPTTTTIDLGTIKYAPEDGMIRSTYKPEIEAEVCFPYETEVSINEFYISDNVKDLSKGKVSSSDNSDAPVHITELKELGGGNEVTFFLTIENVGKGKVLEEGRCFEEVDEIVNVEILAPSGVNCNLLDGSSGSVELVKDKRKLTCSVEVSQEKEFGTPLEAILSYNYALELSKDITIIKTSTR